MVAGSGGDDTFIILPATHTLDTIHHLGLRDGQPSTSSQLNLYAFQLIRFHYFI